MRVVVSFAFEPNVSTNVLKVREGSHMASTQSLVHDGPDVKTAY